MFTETQAIEAFIGMDALAQSKVSMAVFNGPKAVAEMARAVMALTGQGVQADGSIGGPPGDPEATVQALFEAMQADKVVAKTFDKAVKASLTREQRYEAMARTIYALGFTFNADGEVGRA